MSIDVDASPVIAGATEPPTNYKRQDRLGQRSDTAVAKWEAVAVALLLIADFAFTVVNSRHWWFTADFWHFAGRQGGDVWFRSYGGHLNIFNVATARLVVADGFDYWPAWGVIRSLFSTAIGFSAWFSLRRAGARPFLALGAAVIIVTFWYDVFITIALVNVPITLSCMALLSHLVEKGHRRRLLAVSALGVAAGSTMVLAVVAMTLVVARRAALRPLLPWLLAPLGPYGLWRLSRPSSGSGGDLWNQGDVPATIWTVIEAGIGTFLSGLPIPALVISLATAVLVVRQLVRLLGSTKLGVHEEFFTIALGLLLFALFRERIHAGFPGTSPRYGYHITFLLVMAVVPGLHFGWIVPRLRVPLEIAMFCSLVAIPLLQLEKRDQSYAYGESLGAVVQTQVLAAGYLLNNGADHYGDQNYLPGPQGGGQLQVNDLVRYLDAGWKPEAPGPLDLDRAQADLITAARQIGAQTEDCEVPPGTLRFSEEASLVITGSPNSELNLEWGGAAFTAPTVLVERLPATGTAEIRLKASNLNSVVVLLGEDQQLCSSP